MQGLAGFRVVDHSEGIAGAYCSKLFADAGADVIKLERPGGDPMRSWSASGQDLGDEDGPLFRYLHASKRSVLGELADVDAVGDSIESLIASADLLIEDRPAAAFDRTAWLECHPGLVILSITPFGLTGPYADRPATEFTIQAESGSIGARGRPGREPYQAGGRIVSWAGGSFAAVAALAAMWGARRTGHGEHIDFSLQSVTSLITNCYIDMMWGILGRPPALGSLPNLETPSIEPTRDGFVGFTTYSAQQMSDFLMMIERTDLRESGEFDQFAQRLGRLEEWEGIVHAYTHEHDAQELIDLAQVLRIPVAPILNGATVREHEQVAARGVYAEDPSGGFDRPLPPYRIDGEGPPAPRPAPKLGEHDARIERRDPNRPAPGAQSLPLEGLRIVDATTWWAGPIATQMLSMLGADVIHVESTKRIDGSRSVGGTFAAQHDDWWECSFIFLSANANKRGITLDLGSEEGLEVFEALVAGADAVVENFSPRVMEGFGVTWEKIQSINPRCHYVRMPAFGLDGPWREFVGFAATMEQMAGLSWLTGHVDDQPRIQRGPCDPLAGMHAAFAFLVALVERESSGRGHFVECSMLEAALNVTAEQVIEYSAHGHLMEREGNRTLEAAPQGLYPCRDHDVAANPQWLALSVETAAQWRALVDWLGEPGWAGQIGDDLGSRRAAGDRIDAELRAVLRARQRDECVAELIALGVPAAMIVDPRTLADHPQFVARGFHETVEQRIVGPQATMTAPFRYASVERWLQRAGPTLGQHNGEVLAGLGYSKEEIAALEAESVIGDWPDGV